MAEYYNIKQVEQLTGISSQNIRFYEKQGLICPVRSQWNQYRQYTNADVHTLKVIRLLRMVDMPLEEIKLVLQKDLSLHAATCQQQNRLEEQAQHLQQAIQMCIQLQAETTPLDALDVDAHLAHASQSGGFSARWLSDWKDVSNAAHANSFVFYPDGAVTNSAEFAQALRAYAKEEKLELVITKQSMYPEFTLDGVRYTAQRNYTSIGRVPTACIYCERMEPITPDVSAPRRLVLDFLHRGWPYLLLLGYGLIVLGPQLPDFWAESPLGTLLILAIAVSFIVVLVFRSRFFLYNENGVSNKHKGNK